MHFHFMAFALCMFMGIQAHAQVAISNTFEDNLALMDILWSQPADAGYKMRFRDKGRLQKADHILYSKKERLEIRVFLYPEKDSAPFIPPAIQATRLCLHLATNDENALITEHNIEENTFYQYANADWGRKYFFQPKKLLSRYQHAELIALYKEDKGTAFLLYLFDQPPPNLSSRYYLLQFNTDKPKIEN